MARSGLGASGQKNPSAGHPAAIKLTGCGKTILVVEDDLAIQSLVTKYLKRLGYTPLKAESAAEALDIWAKRHEDIDLLLTDLMMPNGMTGLDLLHAARAERPDLKVVLTSGYPAQVIEQRVVPQLDAPLLSKPYRKRLLALALRRALES